MNEDLVTYYARRAQEYERVYRKPERQADLALLADYVRQAFLDQRVIEIACGTGYWTQYVAQTARSVVATDINSAMIDVALAKNITPQNVSFRLADLYALPEPDPPFDAGFGGFIWSHISRPKLPEFLGSFHRQVKRGGTIMFIDNRYVAGSSTPMYRKDQAGDTFQKRQLENGEEYVVLKNFPAASELRATLRPIAHDVQVISLTYYWMLTYRVK